MSVLNKTTTRLPEAMFVTFNPADVGGGFLDKLGELVNVTDVVDGGAMKIHFVASGFQFKVSAIVCPTTWTWLIFLASLLAAFQRLVIGRRNDGCGCRLRGEAVRLPHPVDPTPRCSHLRHVVNPVEQLVVCDMCLHPVSSTITVCSCGCVQGHKLHHVVPILKHFQ